MKISKIINWNPLVKKREGRFNIMGDNAYKFDRWLFNSTILIIICLLLYVFSTYGFDFTPKIYIKCEEACDNPFYIGPEANREGGVLSLEDKQKCTFEWCKEKSLPAGFEFGKRPSPLYNNIGPVCYLLFALALILNHFLYNKGKLKRFTQGLEEEE